MRRRPRRQAPPLVPPPSSRRFRAALVAAALAACAVGLSGADGGLLWMVAGVFTVRAVWGSPPGYAWGIFCLGVGARWGTLGLGGVETAARIFGPASTAGSGIVRIAMAAALAAAVLGEARIDGLRAPFWGPRAAAFVAAIGIVGLAAAPGPGRTGLEPSLVWWAVAGVVVVGVTLFLAGFARRLPGWVPPVAAVAGVAIAIVAS